MRAVKKIFCVMLCAAILVCSMQLTFSVSAADMAEIPVIYIRGRGTELYDFEGTDQQKQIYPLEYTKEYILEKVKGVVPVLAKAIITDDYSQYCDFLYESIAPIFAGLKLDDNGNARNDSDISWSWPETPLKNKANSRGQYDIYAYVFRYDWRLDPCETSASLNDYVKAVKAATGAEKVSIICRCYATDLVAAYLTQYGHSDIDTTVLYNPTTNGIDTLGEIFSGKMSVDSDAVERFAAENLGEGTLNDFLKATVALLNADCKLDLTATAIEAIFNKVKGNVLPRLLIDTYANMPAYWSMIGDKDYEDAKNLIFGGKEQQYSQLIAKLDNYHYNVQLKFEQTIKTYMDEGMRFALITKYGYQAAPVTETVNEVTDNTISLYSQSFGATCSSYNGTLSDGYINQLTENGLSRYLSPDKQIDASTGAFPDYTWYIKNIDHKDFPGSVNDLLMSCVRGDSPVTVNDLEKYPQFLIYDSENDTVLPQTEENTGSPTETLGFFVSLFRFMKTLFQVLKALINGTLTGIEL